MTDIAPKPRKKRRPQRRDEILASAVQLFHERGYHATGMDDIGAATGITGSAIYRHFKSKEDILETIVAERANTALEEGRAIVEATTSPRATLEALAAHYVQTMVDNPSLAFVGLFERRTVRPETKAALDRAERLYVEEWVHALTQLRPELSEAEARVLVHGAVGVVIGGGTFRSGLEKQALQRLLTDMMMNAVMTTVPSTTKPTRRSAPRRT